MMRSSFPRSQGAYINLIHYISEKWRAEMAEALQRGDFHLTTTHHPRSQPSSQIKPTIENDVATRALDKDFSLSYCGGAIKRMAGLDLAVVFASHQETRKSNAANGVSSVNKVTLYWDECALGCGWAKRRFCILFARACSQTMENKIERASSISSTSIAFMELPRMEWL